MTLSKAKINIGLNIPFKRKDGYHEIRSFFVPIDFGDDLDFEIEPASWVSNEFKWIANSELKGFRKELFDRVSLGDGYKKNILFKTFQASSPFFKVPLSIKIHLTKRLPPEGGIGGGSSNAGTMLQALIPYLTLSDEGLQSLARELGADVPFFLQSKPCYVSGVGEILEPISVAKGFGVLAIPEITLSTREMFQALQKDLQETPLSKPWKSLEDKAIGCLRMGDWAGLTGLLENDFEKVAFLKCPTLEAIKTGFLQKGALFSSLSGSGSCMFGIVSSEKEATQLAKQMTSAFPDLDFRTFSFE